jgi:predicted Zn-dependent peptidase
LRFRQHTLANGLEIIAECNPAAYSAAIAFFVKTGSRDETTALSGVSHFLEHMAFKGTPTRSAADVNRELDEMGAHSNAFTSEEQTAYYITVLPEYQDRALDLLSDMMRPSLRPADFETEKQVILEEIAKYDDQPPFGAHEKSMALHFQEHPLSRSVLGTLDSVSALSPDQMRGYFECRYVPNNLTLAAAGNVDFDRLVRLAERRCGGWQPQPVQRLIPRAAANRDSQVFPNDIATQQRSRRGRRKPIRRTRPEHDCRRRQRQPVLLDARRQRTSRVRGHGLVRVSGHRHLHVNALRRTGRHRGQPAGNARHAQRGPAGRNYARRIIASKEQDLLPRGAAQ